MKTISRYIMTLALLLTAVTGAWAEEKMVTINSSTMSSGAVTATGFYQQDNFLFVGPNPATITTSEGVITKLVIKKYNGSFGDAFTEANVGVAPGTITYGTDEITVTDINAESVTLSRKGGANWSTSSVDVYFGTAEAPVTVEWNASTKTGTFEMPAFDVEIAPIYAPVVQWAKDKEVDQIPAAIEGIYAGTTDAIVKAGTVAMMGKTENPQGTLMYAVTSTNQATAPELSAFSADLPTAKDIADEGADVLVWYYIKGADTPQGQTATAENTFNDSEICAEPIKVTVLSNKYDIQFTAANANTIEAGKATVKVGETAAEVKEGKLTGVKMGSKVTVTAKEGYKFRKAEGKKTQKPLN